MGMIFTKTSARFRATIATSVVVLLTAAGAGSAFADGDPSGTPTVSDTKTSFSNVSTSGISGRMLSTSPGVFDRKFTSIHDEFDVSDVAFIPGATPGTGTLYAVNHFYSTVEVIDVSTMRVTSRLTGLSGPTGLALSVGATSNSGILYISEGSGNDVTMYDLAKGQYLKDIPFNQPDGIALIPGDSSTTGTLVVTSNYNAKVSFVDIATGNVLSNLPINSAKNVALAEGATATSGTMYLTISTGIAPMANDQIAVVDIATNTVTQRFSVPGVRQVRTLPGQPGTLLAVTADNKIITVDAATGAITSTITNVSSDPSGPGNGAHSVVYVPGATAGTGTYYVGAFLGAITVVDQASQAITKDVPGLKVPQGNGTFVPGTDPNTGTFYVASRLANGVPVVDVASDSITDFISLAKPVDQIAVLPGATPGTGTLYFRYQGETIVRILDIATKTITGQLTGHAGDTMTISPAVGAEPARLYIASSAAKNVAVINTATNAKIDTIPLGFAAGGLFVVPGAASGSGTLYASNATASNSVTSFDLATHTAGTTISGFSAPRGVWVVPGETAGTGRLFVVESGGVVRIADLATSQVKFAVRSGFNGAGIGVSTATGTDGGTIYALDGTMGMATIRLGAVTITPDTLPDGVTTVPYSQTITADGSPGPTMSYTGDLPPGLELDVVTGILSGVPTTVGSYTFTVTASNGVGQAASVTYTVNIGSAPVITSDAPTDDAAIDTAYSYTVTATGTPVPTFSITDGALPTGLTMDSVTGVISGTPTASGTFTFTVRATNVHGFDEKSYTLVVPSSGAPTPDPTDTPTPEPSVVPTADPTVDPQPSTTPTDSASDPAAPAFTPPSNGSDLPNTGSNSGGLIAIAGVLLAAGAIAAVLAKRRRDQH